MEHFYYANNFNIFGLEGCKNKYFSIYKWVVFTHFIENYPFRNHMKESEVMDKLIPYQSGGNYFLLYKIIKENSHKGLCELTQQELADKIQKTRKFVSEGLRILEEIKSIESGYKKIQILGDNNV